MAGIRTLPARARFFVLAVIGLGPAAIVASLVVGPPDLTWETTLFVVLAVAAGLVKVPLPVKGSLSLGFAFVFATQMGFGLGAATLAGVLTALASAVAPSREAVRRPLHHTLFNTGLVGIASFCAGSTFLALGGRVGELPVPGDTLAIVAYTFVFAVVNVVAVSWVLHLSGGEGMRRALGEIFKWSIPGYLAGSSLAVLLNLLLGAGNPAFLLLAAPFVYLVHVAHRARAEKLEEARHASEQTAVLYRGVTEALARAIEAKDENTEEHLERVQQYCLGIARVLGLPGSEVEALRAASLLHDIGKIAVPEYVLTKPGKLTDEERELMQVHPVVGAEILEAVPFPFPLAPIVRHHHERWDGGGYPDGLVGERIPLGARILTVVDCYDALISDRPYRKGVSRETALEFIRSESGRMFDPEIVDLLVRHAEELERQVRRRDPTVPGATSRASGTRETPDDEDIIGEIDPAELADLEPGQRVELLAARIGTRLPYRTLVVYTLDAARGRLVAEHVIGEAAEWIRGIEIPVGERMSGWSVLHQKPYAGVAHRTALELDGSRSDLEELFGREEIGALQAAVVAPLTGSRGRLGAVALYREGMAPYDDEDAARLARAVARAAPWVERGIGSTRGGVLRAKN